MDQSFLQSLKDFVNSNLDNEQFGAEDISREIGLSRSQVHRKLQKINGKSITQFIRETRLDVALELLKKEVGTASEIAYKVGFSSPAYFTKCFHEYFGYPPGEVKKRSLPRTDESPGSSTPQGRSTISSFWRDQGKQIKIKEGERRHATVLFADMSGFTSISEKMDPEEVTYLVDECMKLIGSCIEAHEGTIDKFIGDCIMALFGLPTSIEHAPVKAINAAIEIRNDFYRFRKKKKINHQIDIHIGINTGIVIAGPVGSESKRDYTVIGDTVNVASRLKDLSKAGQIFVGPNTYRYTKDHFQFKFLESVAVKGKQDKIEVYQLLSHQKKPHRSQRFTSRMIYSTLIGRNKELDMLSLHLLKVINGEGSIVNVTGEAGIGKSRLIEEIRKKPETKRVTLLEGRAISSGQNLSFYPIIDLLKNWSGAKDEDTKQMTHVKLEKKIASIAKHDLDEIFPFIATLMGLKLTGKYLERVSGIEGNALEKLILKSLDALLIKMADSRPLLILLEDLHWIDQTSLLFLESLFRISTEHPILFINVFRPGYESTGGRLLKTIEDRYASIAKHIMLKPLSEDDCEDMINNLLNIPDFPVEVKDQMAKRTGGNPFFIEEIIRSFIDEGIIVVKNDRFELTRKIDAVIIPGTINEVIMSRIDRLDEKSRSLLKVASVIGRSFYYKILKHMTTLENQLDHHLKYMEEIQLILKQSSEEELTYLFKHALAQEATYESILLKKRKELHLKTASAIEEIFPDNISEFYGILSWHYSKAENFQKAEEYLLKAGEGAMRTSASSEAIHYYREALRLYSMQSGGNADKEKIAVMEQNIGIAYLNKGQFIEALQYFDRVLAFHGIRNQSGKLNLLIAMISGIFHLSIAYFTPFLKWNRIPTSLENRINSILGYQLICMAVGE